MFVPEWRRTDPASAARNGSQVNCPSRAARAAPARTGMTEAGEAKGRRISRVAPSRRRAVSTGPSRRSSASDPVPAVAAGRSTEAESDSAEPPPTVAAAESATGAAHRAAGGRGADGVPGGGVALGPPGGRDPVAQLGLEAGSPERDVGQHRHHVDHEGLALRPASGLAPGPAAVRPEGG